MTSRRPRARRALEALLLSATAALASTPVAAEVPGAFPHLDPWPRSLALGGLPAGLGAGVQAVLENPASMLTEPARGAAFSHASLFEGSLVKHQAAALCWVRYESVLSWEERGEVVRRRGEARSAYGLGVTNLSGDLPGDDSYGELEVALAYARSGLLGLSFGARGRFLQARSTVDGSDGGGFALDLGLEGALWGTRAGITARALASEIRWDRSLDDPLPRAFDFALERGFGRGVTAMAGGTLRGSGELRGASAALEWHLPRLPLCLRSGPTWRDDGWERRTEVSAGLGLLVGSFAFDYGFRSGPPGLGELHRFGLLASFR